MSIHLLGQLALDFAVSVPQILAAIGTSALIEVLITFARTRMVVSLDIEALVAVLRGGCAVAGGQVPNSLARIPRLQSVE